jgi:cytochrome c biogenesis protein CcmG/thiol:disulfide interchange protein DsbE
MRRFLVPGVGLLLAAGLIALLAFGVSAQGTTSSIDSLVAQGRYPVVPNAHMALPRLGAPGTQTLAALRGKVVVVNIFASWCDPCKAEAPVLEQEQSYLAAHGGTILGVTYEDDTNSAESFVRQWHLTYPVVRDVSGSFAHGLGSTGVPETFVIDRQGRVAALRRYQLAGNWLADTVARIAAEPS